MLRWKCFFKAAKTPDQNRSCIKSKFTQRIKNQSWIINFEIVSLFRRASNSHFKNFFTLNFFDSKNKQDWSICLKISSNKVEERKLCLKKDKRRWFIANEEKRFNFVLTESKVTFAVQKTAKHKSYFTMLSGQTK